MRHPRWFYFYMVYWVLLAALSIWLMTSAKHEKVGEHVGDVVIGAMVIAFVGGMILNGLFSVRNQRIRERRWKEEDEEGGSRNWMNVEQR